MTDLAIYRMLDVLFVVVHTLLVGFNMLGWAWRRTRRLHLIAISATLLSWFGLGLKYGWGYCPLTDWHWDVKRALGETGLPASWLKYYLDLVTGLDWSAALVDGLVIGSALAALALSVVLNLRDARARWRDGGRPRSWKDQA
ncbi:MAG: DUF2784 domain-containing protein [Gemmatimonadetes bacterium]|nr:DUF2784 domain-containing protein [Gemmatimonadota bacterium]